MKRQAFADWSMKPAVMVGSGSARGKITHWWMSLSRNGKRVGWVSACGKKVKMLHPPYSRSPDCKHCQRAW